MPGPSHMRVARGFRSYTEAFSYENVANSGFNA